MSRPPRQITGLPDVFTVTANGSDELSPARVRTARYLAPSRGLRVNPAAADLAAARAVAALAVAPTHAVLADVAAARWWGLPLPAWIALDPDVDVTVAVPAGAGRPQRKGVRGRRLSLPAEHVMLHRDQNVTTPARTWLDCAELVPTEHLVAMGDVLLRRQLAGRAELEAMVRWARRRRGVVNARKVLPVLDGRAESPGESIARYVLIREGIPRPECNYDIVFGDEWLARADMAWPDRRVIVEYDGLVHLDEAQRRRDASRRNLLHQAGWTVITFTAADLTRPWAMASLVRSALAAHPSTVER